MDCDKEEQAWWKWREEAHKRLWNIEESKDSHFSSLIRRHFGKTSDESYWICAEYIVYLHRYSLIIFFWRKRERVKMVFN
jgi:hypothetical protein